MNYALARDVAKQGTILNEACVFCSVHQPLTGPPSGGLIVPPLGQQNKTKNILPLGFGLVWSGYYKCRLSRTGQIIY